MINENQKDSLVSLTKSLETQMFLTMQKTDSLTSTVLLLRQQKVITISVQQQKEEISLERDSLKDVIRNLAIISNPNTESAKEIQIESNIMIKEIENNPSQAQKQDNPFDIENFNLQK